MFIAAGMLTGKRGPMTVHVAGRFGEDVQIARPIVHGTLDRNRCGTFMDESFCND